MSDSAARVMVVTGASSGIGRELALQLAGPSVVLWLIGRDQGRLDEAAALARGKGAEVHVVPMDLTDLAASERFLNERFSKGVRVDGVYLSAAVSLFGEVVDVLPEDWERIYQTNLLSPLQWLRHFYGNMVEQGAGGRIVLVSSLAAYSGYPTATPYATMKAGLTGLFRSLDYESRSHGISLVLASPGYVDTGIYRSAIFRRTTYERTMAQIKSLGFGIITAEAAARRILEGERAGRREFAFPLYAAAMKWIAPRLPWMLEGVHARIVKDFRKA